MVGRLVAAPDFVVRLGEEAGQAATGSEHEHRTDDKAEYGDDYSECCVEFGVSIRAEKACSRSNSYQCVRYHETNYKGDEQETAR